MEEKITRTDAEGKKILTPEQYRVMREKGTERPFSSELLEIGDRDGEYYCAACGNLLFPADTKFESGTGWPSFNQAVPGSVKLNADQSGGMARTEVVCAKCGAHLGHVFNDAPDQPTGQRYCINGVCLKHDAADKKAI
jgi:peptide-methionine (R)-S-oxide reductase